MANKIKAVVELDSTAPASMYEGLKVRKGVDGPVIGQVRNVRKEGNKTVADLEYIDLLPEAVKEMMSRPITKLTHQSLAQSIGAKEKQLDDMERLCGEILACLSIPANQKELISTLAEQPQILTHKEGKMVPTGELGKSILEGWRLRFWQAGGTVPVDYAFADFEHLFADHGGEG